VDLFSREKLRMLKMMSQRNSQSVRKVQELLSGLKRNEEKGRARRKKKGQKFLG
jgi:hypothetical protein